MKHSYALAVFLLFFYYSTLQSQNRVKFKYKLSQKNLIDCGFSLYRGNNLMTIQGNQKLKCLIKLDSKGNILVDFWQITSTDPSLDSNSTVVNDETRFDQNNLPTLKDGRSWIGSPTKVLWVPFNGGTFGLSTIPFRVRFKGKTNDSTKVNATITSPKPDVSFTAGWTWGKSMITSRNIVNLSVTAGAFVGLGSADLKTGVIKTKSDLTTTKATQTNMIITYGASLTFARNNIGIILAAGVDNNVGTYAEDWIYQNKIWMGIGINANLAMF